MRTSLSLMLAGAVILAACGSAPTAAPTATAAAATVAPTAPSPQPSATPSPALTVVAGPTPAMPVATSIVTSPTAGLPTAPPATVAAATAWPTLRTTSTPPPAATATAPLAPTRPVPADPAVTDVVAVDGERGRLYARAQAGGRDVVAALSADDGSVLQVLDLAGPIDVDPALGLLYADRGAEGLAVVDAATGSLLRSIALPSLSAAQSTPVAPLADTAHGQAIAFRGNTAIVLDPRTGETLRTLTLAVESAHDCRTAAGLLPVESATLDAGTNTLYAQFLTYVCTPWYGYTVVAFDAGTGTEIGRQGGSRLHVVAEGGALYARDWQRFGIGSHWLWRGGALFSSTTDWAGMPEGPGQHGGLVVDTARGRLYEALGGSVREYSADTFALLAVYAAPAPGRLAAIDGARGLLYFLADGKVTPVPISSLAAGTPAATQPPSLPVSAVVPSDRWPLGDLYAVWGLQQPEGECYVFNQWGGLPFVSSDGGSTWLPTGNGLPTGCLYVSTVALSPAYDADGTGYAAVAGWGLFRTTNRGSAWSAVGAGLPSAGVQQILVSPGYAADNTVFVRGLNGGLYRSQDGGASWQPVRTDAVAAALSPEFAQDGTLMVAAPMADGAAGVYVSRDRGQQWQYQGQMPGQAWVTGLSMAPLFAKWGVAFALADGVLYRTADAGVTWTQVLAPGSQSGLQAIAYAPGAEEDRAVYALFTGSDWSTGVAVPTGLLCRSGDGGLSWQAVTLPDGSTPTALALSPGFAQDATIIVGTADGRVLRISAPDLVGG